MRALWGLLFVSLAQAAPSLQVVYPPANHHVTADHVILEGHASPGASLSVNGQAVQVDPDGLFMTWWPLHPGDNALRLTASQGSERYSLSLNVSYDAPRPPAVRPSTLRPESVQPAQDIVLYGAPEALRRVQLRLQASPGGQASAQLGSGAPIPLIPGENGWYSASLSVPPQAGAQQVTYSFTGLDGRTLRATAPGHILSEDGPRVATVSAPDLGLGVNPATRALSTGPLATQQLFARQGEQLTVWRQDEDGSAVTAPDGYAQAPSKLLELLPANTPIAQVRSSAPSLQDLPGEWLLRWPLSGRVPFDLREEGEEHPNLLLKLSGVSGDGGELKGPVTLRWTGNDLLLSLPQPLWGYWANYAAGSSVLELHVRKPPMLNPAAPLQGRLILIDPGHGGSELGAVGSFGVPEKDIVLPIARRVAELLRAQGADARLTRERDVQVPLYDRPLLAEQLRADLLVSIHANALPDGVNPRTHQGLEVHTYHPMTFALARQLLKSIPAAVPGLSISGSASPERDPMLTPGLMLSNLALTRPSSQRSLLIETGYLTDAADLRRLMNPLTQEAYARGIAAGIAADFAARASQQTAPTP